MSKTNERICAVCLKRFYDDYCSPECHRKAIRTGDMSSHSPEITHCRKTIHKRNLTPLITKTCIGCACEFFTQYKQQKYHSVECRNHTGFNPNRRLVSKRGPFFWWVLNRDNFTCQYCGRTPKDGVKLTMDHIKPWMDGGKTIAENLVSACDECNSSKNSRPLKYEAKFKENLSKFPKFETPMDKGKYASRPVSK